MKIQFYSFTYVNMIYPFLLQHMHDMPVFSKGYHIVEQELLPFRNTWVHPVVNVVRFTRYFVLCLCFKDRGLSFWHFSFDHCVVCPSIYGF